MMTRYSIASLFKSIWSLLSWKGDKHTQGVYFNKEYGYVIQPTYAIRIKHDEPAPTVFYIPDTEDDLADEVVTEYPFNDLCKTTRDSWPLYQGSCLTVDELERIFEGTADDMYSFPIQPLYELLAGVSNKRKRDRTMVHLKITGQHARVTLIDKKSEEPFLTIRLDIYSHHHSNDDRSVKEARVNANNMLHTLNFLKKGDVIHLGLYRDKIKITSFSTVHLEAVLSLIKTKG